jgi:hypothetical protein
VIDSVFPFERVSCEYEMVPPFLVVTTSVESVDDEVLPPLVSVST